MTEREKTKSEDKKGIPSSIFNNFLKLCPYFRGKHTVEEMLFQTQLRREDVRQVLSVYGEILVASLHPDPTV